MPTPEHAVLKPIDPSITDSDDYEIFVLSDVQVVYESNGRLASLLVAYADTPLRVEGRLEAPGRGQAKCRECLHTLGLTRHRARNGALVFVWAVHSINEDAIQLSRDRTDRSTLKSAM